MAKLTVTVTVLFLSLVISVASSKPENDINLPTLAPELASSDEVIVPVNFVNFHPINRHFPRRPLMTVPFNLRPCHHHHRGIRIPYGNDMIISDEEKTTESLSDGVVVTDIKMLVDPFVSEEETKHNPGREIDNSGEVAEEEEEEGSMKITVTLIKRKEEGERENTLGRKIRKFLNHLV